MGTASGIMRASASEPLLGEVGKFSLCVRYHPVQAAWLHGTCSSLGKTLNFCISFLRGHSLCVASLKYFSDFAPNSRLWPGCLFYGVCGGNQGKQFKLQSSLLLRRLLASSRISKQSSDHSLPQFSYLYLNFPICKREIMRHNDSFLKNRHQKCLI